MKDVRDELARILEDVAKYGLPGPRDLDVALDAILCTVEGGSGANDGAWLPADEAPHGVTVEVRIPGPIHARLVGWEMKHWGIYAAGKYVGRARLQPSHFRYLESQEQ